MKTPSIKNSEQATSAAKETLSFQKVLMGLRLDDSLPPILKYTRFLSDILSFKEVSFLNVVPYFHPVMFPYTGNAITGYPLGEIYSPNHFKREDQELKHLERELKEKVKEIWQSNAKTALKYEIVEGAPLIELVEKAKEIAADLVIIGKSADTKRHQINAKNIIRQTAANVLLVPEKAEPVLEKILVPFDFSENAIRALKFAVAIKDWMPTPVVIQVLNVYQEPNIPAYVLHESQAKFSEDIASRHKEAFDNFLAEELPELQHKIHPITFLKGNRNVAYYVMQKATAYNSDLIIMGAKGHSKLELLLMGSTTERVVGRNNSIPTLIVK